MVRSWLSRVVATGIFQRLSVVSGAFSVALMGIIYHWGRVGRVVIVSSMGAFWTQGCQAALLGADVPFFRGTTGLAVSVMGRLPRWNGPSVAGCCSIVFVLWGGSGAGER
jgi:hypothetical protein